MILIRNALILSLLMVATLSQVYCQNIVPNFSINVPLQPIVSTISDITTANRNSNGPHTFAVKAEASAVAAANQAKLENFQSISQSAQSFALDLLATFSDAIAEAARQSNRHTDFMISPFSIWSLLMLLVEGADGKTLQELRSGLRLEDDQTIIRAAFRAVEQYLNAKTPAVEVASLQALFTDKNQPLMRDYERIVERDYNSKLIPVDFHDPVKTYTEITEAVRESTRGLITHAINPYDLKDVNLFMLSSLFFKGQWKTPFNKTFTRSEPFYDEAGNVAGNVDMMYQELNAKYTGMNDLQGHVLELPYGQQDRLSMLLILPKKGVGLDEVFRNLQKIGLAPIFNKLNADSVGFEDDTIEVYLPKFSTASDFVLNVVLEKLGIHEIFSNNANLTKMSASLKVSNIIHSTKIIVNEEGTTAAAITGAILSNKSTPPKFYLNRPFIYLIVEKTTNLLLFAGQLINPNNVS